MVSRGWSLQKIADAVERNRGQISQTFHGSKPSHNLVPALSALADRTHVPVGREKPRPAPNVPPKVSSGRKGVPAPVPVEERRIGASGRVLRRARSEAGARLAIQRAGDRQVQIRVRWIDKDGKQQTTTLFKRGGWNARTLDGAIGEQGLGGWVGGYLEGIYDPDDFDHVVETEVLEL